MWKEVWCVVESSHLIQMAKQRDLQLLQLLKETGRPSLFSVAGRPCQVLGTHSHPISKLCSLYKCTGYLVFVIVGNMAIWRTNVITYVCVSSFEVVLVLLGFQSEHEQTQWWQGLSKYNSTWQQAGTVDTLLLWRIPITVTVSSVCVRTVHVPVCATDMKLRYMFMYTMYVCMCKCEMLL